MSDEGKVVVFADQLEDFTEEQAEFLRGRIGFSSYQPCVAQHDREPDWMVPLRKAAILEHASHTLCHVFDEAARRADVRAGTKFVMRLARERLMRSARKPGSAEEEE